MNKKNILYSTIALTSFLICFVTLFIFNITQIGIYAFISLCFFVPTIIFAFILARQFDKQFNKKSKKSEILQQTSNEQLSSSKLLNEEDEIDKLYKSIKQYPKLGVAKFVKSGMEFDIDGTFYYKKDYNDIEGYHFAFFIKSTKLNYIPENNDDFYLFNEFFAEIGYHDEFPLEEENECGVIVQDLKNINNTTIDLDYNDGYVFILYTVDFDTIDYGQLKIIEFNNDTITISFKLAVKEGLDDIAIGTVKLKLDTQEGLDN